MPGRCAGGESAAHVPGPAAPGDGMLAACLAFLVAVLVAASGTPRQRAFELSAVGPAVGFGVVNGPVQRLIFARLCVLRT